MGQPHRLPTLIRDGFPRVLVLPQLTVLRRKDQKSMEKGKTRKVLSGQAAASFQAVAQVNLWEERDSPVPLSAKRRDKVGYYTPQVPKTRII